MFNLKLKEKESLYQNSSNQLYKYSLLKRKEDGDYLKPNKKKITKPGTLEPSLVGQPKAESGKSN